MLCQPRKHTSIIVMRPLINYQLKEAYLSIYFQALWCSLNDVVSLQKTWSDEACDMFKDLVEHKLITVVVKGNFTPTTQTLGV